MTTIYNKMAVRMNTWNINSPAETAMIMDMGTDPFWSQYVKDEDRVYAGSRSIFLSNDPRSYEADEIAYANPVVLTDGEIVMLEDNGKLYKVVDMTKGKWEYLSDPIHFELVKC